MILLAMSIIILSGINAQAQNPGYAKELGREFYFNFMPNVHKNEYEIKDTLQIFITSEKPTSVIVEAYNIDRATPFVSRLTLEANSSKLLKYHFDGFELRGDYVTKYNESQRPVKCGFHIISDEEIYVYALTSSDKSSDAMIIYPVESLGREYTVLSYTSDFLYNTQPTPSQFSIIATEDNTKITISPSSITSKGNKNPFSIVLNKNESYLVQSGLGDDFVFIPDSCDLTGTQIIADKRIAVFGGHQRARIPYFTRATNPSRDFICEQLQAQETWGKNALIAPCPYADVDNGGISDVFRIVSASDNNIIRVGGELIGLNKGQFYEGRAEKAMAIYAGEPIMIAQYKRTSRMNSDGFTKELGDPLMILIPPVEQFVKEATFLAFSNQEKGRRFNDHYVVIVAPADSLSDMYIDNMMINPNKFQKISNSRYSYSTIRLNKDGVHKFKANVKCGIYCYGYGYANSYGYAGGMRPQYLDVYKPKINLTEDNCNDQKLFIDDNKHLSYGMKKVVLMDNQSKNVQIDDVRIDNQYNTAEVKLSLIEKDRDGYYTLKAIDNGDNFAMYSDTIAGSALKFINLDKEGRIHLKIDNSFNRSCAKIMLQNNSLTVKTLNSIEHTNMANYSFPPSQFPLSLAPGEIKELTICSQYKNKEINTNNIDTIKISDTCIEANAIVQVEYDPFVRRITSKCGVPLELTISSIPDELFIENTNDLSEQGKIHTTLGIDKDGLTMIKMYDLNGREVMDIHSGELKAGIYKSSIDCSDISAGVYLINLHNNGKSTSSKIIINN